MTEELHCSFCGKGESEVRQIVAGPKVFICNNCVRICTEVLSEAQPDWFDEYIQFVNQLQQNRRAGKPNLRD
jgi:ATP-dependent protease Clp ATPase subunit